MDNEVKRVEGLDVVVVVRSVVLRMKLKCFGNR